MDIGSIKNPLNWAGVGASRQSASAAQSAVGPKAAGDQPAMPNQAEKPAAEREQLESAVSSIQEFVQSVKRSINFALDDESGRVVVKVTDASTGDVIRQIPSEEAIRLADSLDAARSVLFKAEA